MPPVDTGGWKPPPWHRFAEGKKKDGLCRVCGRRAGASVHKRPTPPPGSTPGQTPGQPGQPTEPSPEEPAENPIDQSAWSALEDMLQQYGLGSLSGWLKDRILEGLDRNTIMLQLQQTNEWRTRFAGNEILRNSGLAVLSPEAYLATERQYAAIMRNFGLPEGFYDDPSDFAKWIGKNVSPAELQQRVTMYSDLANREDPAIVAQLQSMGMGKGDLMAYIIDPDRAAPLIQRQYQTALIGGAARRAGMGGSDLDNDYLGRLSEIGVTEQQAAQGYGLIAGSLDDAETLASIYGVQYGVRDMESEVFENNATSGKKRKRLASQERAAFSGSAGVGRLGNDPAGSY